MSETTKAVTRYVVTYVNSDGMRTLASAAQGRYTYATYDEAESALNALRANNSKDTLRSVYGSHPQFEVRPCECWPGHFDPVGVWFNDAPEYQVQGKYPGGQWETVCTEETREEARRRLREYDENEPQYPHRIRRA